MDEQLRDDVRRALLAGPELELAFVFGSTARGSARPGSDLDVAILPVDRTLSLAEESDLVASVERAGRRPVDLIRLDGAPAALLWRVARDGVLLVERAPGAGARWRARVAIDHAEFEPTLRAGVERYRAAVARGPSR